MEKIVAVWKTQSGTIDFAIIYYFNERNDGVEDGSCVRSTENLDSRRKFRSYEILPTEYMFRTSFQPIGFKTKYLRRTQRPLSTATQATSGSSVPNRWVSWKSLLNWIPASHPHRPKLHPRRSCSTKPVDILTTNLATASPVSIAPQPPIVPLAP